MFETKRLNSQNNEDQALAVKNNLKQPPTIIKAGLTEKLYWTDLWRYRELLLNLSLRDISVRYKQTFVGVAWAVVRPVMTMVILVIVFSKVANLSSGEIPYPLLVMTGMLCWQLFSTGLTSVSESLVGSSHLISKVYFPRLIIPISSMVLSLVDFLVSLPILIFLMLWYGDIPNWKIVFFPVFTLLTMATSLSVGLWMSSLNVRYRDVRYVLPFLIQFGVYVSPVGYALAAVPLKYHDFFELNPLTGIIEGFRWSLLPEALAPSLKSVLISCGFIIVLSVTGIRYFRRTERSFADVI